MGDIASNLSSKVIFTSDNPRYEDPDSIIEEMLKGVKSTNTNKTISITNRKEAIKTACQFAQSNDIILVAGKGHESYQEVKGVKSDFDDFKIIKELLNQKNSKDGPSWCKTKAKTQTYLSWPLSTEWQSQAFSRPRPHIKQLRVNHSTCERCAILCLRIVNQVSMSHMETAMDGEISEMEEP